MLAMSYSLRTFAETERKFNRQLTNSDYGILAIMVCVYKIHRDDVAKESSNDNQVQIYDYW